MRGGCETRAPFKGGHQLGITRAPLKSGGQVFFFFFFFFRLIDELRGPDSHTLCVERRQLLLHFVRKRFLKGAEEVSVPKYAKD